MSTNGIRFNVCPVELPPGFIPGERFFKVCFRIKRRASRLLPGAAPISPKEEATLFYREVRGLLATLQCSFGSGLERPSLRDSRAGESLQIRLDTITGALLYADIEAIHNALASHTGSFHGQWTDVYESLEIISENELLNRVALSRAEIEKSLISGRRIDEHRSERDWCQYALRLPGFSFMSSRCHSSLLSQEIKKIAHELAVFSSSRGTSSFEACDQARSSKMYRL